MSELITTTAQVRKSFPSSKIKPLHKVNTLIGIGSILLEWGLIISCAMLCETYFTWYFYLLAMPFIGARYLALGLIMHESVHRLIAKNELLNDWLSEIFCSWPLLVSMRSYRIKHLAHHAHLNTDDDPDHIGKSDVNWQFPMNRKKLLKILLLQISGLGFFEAIKVMSGKRVKNSKSKNPRWYLPLRLIYYLGIVAAFIITGNGLMLVLYWAIPFFTWTQFINRLRRIAEHSAVESKFHDLQTRTVKHGLLARIFLSPKFISYHNEHHIYPGIPCYNLRRTHNLLMKNKEIQSCLTVSNSYYEVYKSCVEKQANV
jgi:fatty acid desaturase